MELFHLSRKTLICSTLTDDLITFYSTCLIIDVATLFIQLDWIFLLLRIIIELVVNSSSNFLFKFLKISFF